MGPRKLRLAAALAAILATTALSPAAAREPARRPAVLAPAASPEAVGFSSERLAKLDAAMAQVVAAKEVAGMTTLLARHGQVVSFKTYGVADLETGAPMERDTIFRIYSMTKPITGVAMMILFEEGRWRLDDPVSNYVPEFKSLKVMTGVDAKGGPVLASMASEPTMRQLMSHTAGFGYGIATDNAVDKAFRDKAVLASRGSQEMIDKTATIPLRYQPGTKWNYSVAVDIQGYIVEKLSGQPLSQFMQQRIFTPLKMSDTAFYTGPERASRLAAVYMGDPKTGALVDMRKSGMGSMAAMDFTRPPSFESGGGGLVSTTDDYARFAQMILNKGELDGARILSPASVELMGTNMIPDDLLVTSDGRSGEANRFNAAVGFGLDFMVVNDPRKAGSLEGEGTMSWGGAAGTWFWVDPTNDVVFVGMIQRMSLGAPRKTDLGRLSRTLVYQALTEPEK
jgi:CubicO group peptidase (beta-lactamase class C family)